MRRYEGIVVGALGTVIIHLLAAIVFFSVKLHSMKKESERDFLLVFERPEEMAESSPLPDISGEGEGISDIDRLISNIVRNLASTDNPIMDPQEYQDRIKEEMIQKGMLGDDNFIDDWKKKEVEEGLSEIAERLRHEIEEEEEAPPLNYQGPTRVYYRLENRYHRDMPIPVYKCEGGGIVSLSIEVDPAGSVTNAKVIPSESDTTDQCLIETALKYARMTRFNNSPAAAPRQSGTITYHFVAQL